jgi:hypothetical protein
VKDAAPVFEVRREKDRTYRWLEGEEQAGAVEEGVDDQHKLAVSVSLSNDKMDALVAPNSSCDIARRKIKLGGVSQVRCLDEIGLRIEQ